LATSGERCDGNRFGDLRCVRGTCTGNNGLLGTCVGNDSAPCSQTRDCGAARLACDDGTCTSTGYACP
jgi:hypothetical protein